jgi:hypothetical protein
MGTHFVNMNTEDRAFFGVTGIIGTIYHIQTIVQAQLLNESMAMIIVKACIVAFISGFVGLFAKKFGEWVYNKITCNKVDK